MSILGRGVGGGGGEGRRDNSALNLNVLSNDRPFFPVNRPRLFFMKTMVYSREEKAIVKIKDRKQRNKVIFNQKELSSKGEQLQDLQFG